MIRNQKIREEELEHSCNCKECTCQEEKNLVLAPKGIDCLLDPYKHTTIGVETPYSTFYNFAEDAEGVLDPEEINVKDLYVHRNMLLNMWRDRVQFLVSHLENFLRVKYNKWLSISMIAQRDHSYLFDMFTFANIVTRGNAITISHGIATSVFNMLVAVQYHDDGLENSNNYQNMIGNCNDISGEVTLGIYSLLTILMDEYPHYVTSALVTPENENICVSTKMSVDYTLSWSAQSKDVNQYKLP